MSRIHSLLSTQKIPAGLEQTWAFFSDPRNLFTITPPFLNLKVKHEPFGTGVYAGQMIRYTVRPLFGMPVSWLTEITHIEPLKMFVDEQRKGPYRLWHHQHHFIAVQGGVEMTDIVHYVLPLGFVGNLLHPFTVKNRLQQIFLYRRRKINEVFGSWPGEEQGTLIIQ